MTISTTNGHRHISGEQIITQETEVVTPMDLGEGSLDLGAPRIEMLPGFIQPVSAAIKVAPLFV